MKKIFILLLLAMVVMFSIPAKEAKAGLFYTNVTLPVSGNCITGKEKVGTAKATTILGLVSTGDAGIKAASQDGNIKDIHYVDQQVESIFIFFIKRTTKVYGY